MSEVNWELIVHRLDEISKAQSEHGNKLGKIEEKLNKLDLMDEKLEEVVHWKSSVQEVVSTNELREIKDYKKKMEEQISPMQFGKLLTEFENIKTFKTQSTMIWVIVQVIMGLVLFWKNIF